MRAILLMIILITGCALRPEPHPVAPVVLAPIMCEVPAGLTAIENEPQRPSGNYTQRDVAEFIVLLHRWGVAGWTRVGTISDWSDECVRRK